MSTRRTGAGQRLGGDHPAFHFIAIIGLVLVALSSFVISFTALLAVAEWQHTPERIHFMTALEIDLPIVVTAVLSIVFKHREQPGPLWIARGFGVIVTIASAGANFLHTVSVGGLDTYQGWIGASFNGFAPISVYICSELVAHLITRPKGHQSEKRRIAVENKALKSELRKTQRALAAAGGAL